MSKQAFISWRPGDAALGIIVQANRICADLGAQGYDQLIAVSQNWATIIDQGLDRE